MRDPTRNGSAPADDESVGDTVDLHTRKERVLHTRVPESLDRHIKRRARNLGISVSTVVRNVLLSTFGLVEDIVTDSANIALSFTGEDTMPCGGRARRRATSGAEDPPPGSEIFAWQEAVLNLNAICDECNAVLRKGTRAAIGVRERPGPRVILCPRCLEHVGTGNTRPHPRGRARRAHREVTLNALQKR